MLTLVIDGERVLLDQEHIRMRPASHLLAGATLIAAMYKAVVNMSLRVPFYQFIKSRFLFLSILDLEDIVLCFWAFYP